MKVNKIKYVLGSVLCLASLSALASSKILANYDELLQALSSGSKVRGIIHFDKCKIESGGGFPKTNTLGFTYDYFINRDDLSGDNKHTLEVISTTKNIFSITKINNLGPVNNYIQIHVLKDNSARILGVLLDPTNYSQKISINYTCPVSSDENQAGLMLFNPDA